MATEGTYADGKHIPPISVLTDAGGNSVLTGQQATEAAPAALTAAAVAGLVPAGGTGAAAGGWDTAPNRDTAIATIGEMKTQINALVVDITALRTKVANLVTKLRTAGILG